MAHKKARRQFDSKAIRNWTLYVIRLKKGNYYVGITSRKDFMKRINQHGGRTGAWVNKQREVEEVVEIQHLGKMTALQANHIENNVMLQYRKRFGALKVRGGYDVSKNIPIIPTYTPGSIHSYIFIISCLVLALILLFILAQQ